MKLKEINLGEVILNLLNERRLRVALGTPGASR